MATPKPTAKSTAKPTGAAPPTESIFAAMKKNAALAKNLAKAKKVVAVREFDGPDGDYAANLNRVSHYTKEGSLGIVLEFRAIDAGEFEGQKLVVFFSFKTSERETVAEVQNRFFETLQLMGIETDIDDDQLDLQLKALIANKSEITLRVKTGRQGGKFINVVGLAAAAGEVADTEYVEEGTTIPDAQEIAEDAAAEEALDEWNDEEVVAEEEVVEEVVEEEADPKLPSTWVGYAMVYKGSEVEVLEADDTALKCIIKDATGKKLKVAFSALTPPAE